MREAIRGHQQRSSEGRPSTRSLMREAIRGHQQRSSEEVIRGQALHPLALEHLFSASCAAWLALSWLSNMRFIDAILSFSDSRS